MSDMISSRNVTPGEAKWVCKNGRLYLKSDTGLTNVSSSDIVSAEYRRNRTINGMSINARPSDEMGLKINRFPATIMLILKLSDKNIRKPFLTLEVSYYQQRIPIDRLPDTDQIIVDSNWYPLLIENLEYIQNILHDTGIKKPGPISLKQALILMKQEIEYLEIIESFNEVSEQSVIPEIPSRRLIDAGLNATLYPYQKTGISWLWQITEEDLGCILADEMGLGKTLQIIALITLNIYKNRGPCLIVTPATLMENWRREFKKFAPGVAVLVHSGSTRTGFPNRLKEYNVIVSSYDTVVRDQSMINMIEWNFVILDEAQAIKNPETYRAIAVKGFSRRSGISVTGTPVENRLLDMWSLMDFANPDLLGTRQRFEEIYDDDLRSAGQLERLITPLMLRRKVSDVAKDLPEKIVITQPVNMTDSEIAGYENLRHSIEEEYGDTASLVTLIRLRQYCSHPLILESGDIRYEQVWSNSSKYRRFMEIMEEIQAQNEKVVLFTSFIALSDLMARDVFQRSGIKTFQIDGRTEIDLRQQIIDRFSESEGTSLLILNPRAAGTGLNITAANHVIHYNLEWNPAVEDQATARVHRRGQKYPVTVHRLFYPDTVEEIIDDRLQRKRHLAEVAVIGTEADIAEAEDIARALKITPAIRRNDGEN